MTADLDWKLRQAADGLRRATEVVPEPTTPTPRRHTGRVVAGAILALVLVGGSILIWDNDERDDPGVSTGPGTIEVTPLVLDPQPAGTTSVVATDLPQPAGEALPGSMSVTLYQGTLAFDGQATVDLAVVEVTDETLAGYGEPATIRGRQGEMGSEGPFGGPAVTWEQSPVREITLASHTLDTSLLLEIAEGLHTSDVIADKTVYLGALPAAIEALDPAAAVHNVEFAGWLAVGRQTPGHVVQYVQGADDFVLLATAVGDVTNLAVLGWMIHAEPAFAGDRPVLLGSVPGAPGKPPCVVATWDRGDGTIGYILATNLGEVELLGLVAQEMREAEDGEWHSLVQESDR